MAIFILSAPLLKCSEPWNWLLWHFEQNHTIEVSGPDSPEQGGMIYISHFWFCPHRACVALQGQMGSQVCWPSPPSFSLTTKASCVWGQWWAVGCMAIQKFRVAVVALAMKCWLGPSPHHPPCAFGLWSPRHCPHLPHTHKASVHGNKLLFT